MWVNKIQDRLLKYVPNAYVGDLPSEPKDAIAIILYGATGNVHYGANSNIMYFEEGMLQFPVIKFVVRNASYETAFYWGQIIAKLFHRFRQDEILGMYMVNSPTYLESDEQKYHWFQVVFRVILEFAPIELPELPEEEGPDLPEEGGDIDGGENDDNPSTYRSRGK